MRYDAEAVENDGAHVQGQAKKVSRGAAAVVHQRERVARGNPDWAHAEALG